MHNSCEYSSRPADNHTHDHEHSNNHAHSHNHSHARSHNHTHPDDSNSHDADGLSMEKAVALLSYMLQHNNHHADELNHTEKLLRASNETAAAALLSEAVHYYIHGNEKLFEALTLLGRKG